MQKNIFRNCALALAISALAACSQADQKTVESPSTSNDAPKTIEVPVSKPVLENSKNQEAANQALGEYKKNKDDQKYKKYAEAVIYSIDEIQSLDYEINSAADVQDLYQVTEIEDLKFINGTDNSATYDVKVGVIRGGHITSSCTVTATYDDSAGLIDWKIPSQCHEF
ncbi:hypothetical protein HLH17_02115 [Acinetobacter sp. ANC 5380]|uniref:Lipoprotein n=1 Tax=Acinetobacter terrae TaxID=2731247 RepID=A0A7Y2RD53_9GAMM|nr:hypothetical protein [Acinetobacter terrae]NNH76497.1 hypothetical protein [Acinetobacter terrae]